MATYSRECNSDALCYLGLNTFKLSQLIADNNNPNGLFYDGKALKTGWSWKFSKTIQCCLYWIMVLMTNQVKKHCNIIKKTSNQEFQPAITQFQVLNKKLFPQQLTFPLQPQLHPFSFHQSKFNFLNHKRHSNTFLWATTRSIPITLTTTRSNPITKSRNLHR